MHIAVHVSGYYDWEPVPADVEVTEADKKAKRVKPSSSGGWLMRVNKTGDTHTTVILPEHQIAGLIIGDFLRDKITRQRHDAVAHYLARIVMPHHAHKSKMDGFDVHDDGPDEKLFRADVARHVDAGNIEPEDVEPLVAAYLHPADAEKHIDHLHAHFGVDKGKLAAKRAAKEKSQ